MTSTKILYVDDEDDIREVAVMSLQIDAGLEVRAAGSGAEALALLEQGSWRPDLLLLDVMMPEMDGPTLLQEVWARQGPERTPVVFITARAQPQDRERLMALGALQVIAKPFDPLTLASEVRAALAKDGASGAAPPDPLAPLRARFLERTAADLEVLRRPEADPETTASVVHRLSGTAGVFGFAEISRLAGVVDDQMHAGQAPDPQALAALIDSLEALPVRRA
jgi:CheY-like chemotaxis protein